MTPLPAYKAAPRRLIKPTGYENATPHADGRTFEANIPVSAKDKKTNADRIETVRKVSFIAKDFLASC
jgi:hypothetical protein